MTLKNVLHYLKEIILVTLKQRLEKLESASRCRFSDVDSDIRDNAFRECMESLRNAIPSDEPKYIELPYSRQCDYRGVINHDEKRHALANRIKAGTLRLYDHKVLNAISIQSLETIGMSAVEFVLMIDDLLESI